MIKKYLLICLSICFASNSFAREVSSKYFEVDLEESLPSLEDLEAKYVGSDKHYYKKYDYHWKIGNIFDAAFKTTISSYGSSGKRIKSQDEENFLEMLNNTPKEHWQYIGPYLHTMVGMPERILNMPGIKETKNQFPTRIAKELEDIEGLEFLSPYLYFVLMPEAWPSYESPEEKVVRRPTKVVLPSYDEEFFDNILAKVPVDEYIDGSSPKPSLKSMSRTINIDSNSPLTTGDIKAFANSIDSVIEFGRNPYNLVKVSYVKGLLEEWEVEEGKSFDVPGIKDTVNPCQRTVQRIKVAGLESDFHKVVAKEGFSPESWAYTCDKTIKAFRKATIKPYVLMTLVNYKNNLYSEELSSLDNKSAVAVKLTMQSIIEMYRAPEQDVKEVRYNIDELRSKFNNTKGVLVDSPLIILY